MKINFSHIGLAKLCGWFGVSRQAYYQDGWMEMKQGVENEIVLKEVLRIRKDHRRIGTRKLYEMLSLLFIDHQIKMGRDKLFDLLAYHHLLVRRRRKNIRTTYSNHWLRKYPNLAKELVLTGPNQLWVSDITYWKVGSHKVYISFITDAWSHKIVGYNLALTLEAIESVKALQMALQAFEGPQCHLTHHSDRGIQYCSHEYIVLLKKYEVQISMTQSGDPLENAIAERVNGIIKEEYLDPQGIRTIKEAVKYLDKAIYLYNTERPHLSINLQTPEYAHNAKKTLSLTRQWKNYYPKKRDVVNLSQD